MCELKIIYIFANINELKIEIMSAEVRNLDSLKKYIFEELINEHPDNNNEHIDEAINAYAEAYHKMKVIPLRADLSMFKITVKSYLKKLDGEEFSGLTETELTKRMRYLTDLE